MPEHANEQEASQQNEAVLRRRLEVLAVEINAGRVKFNPGMRVVDELKNVRTLLDGSVDLSTVSSSVRAVALAIEQMVNEREAKAISLSWIQTQYFNLLEDIFADVIKLNRHRRLPPHGVAEYLSEHPEFVDGVLSQVDGIRSTINEFWQDRDYVVEVHLRDFPGVKAVYGGDVFPTSVGSTPMTAALYSDTVILPDPLHRVLNHVSNAVNKSQLVFQLIKHGLHVLALKDMVFAEIEQPMVVFAPSGLPSEPPKWWMDTVEQDAVFHINTAMGSDFDSLDAAMKFLQYIKAPEELAAKSIRSERLLFSADITGDLTQRVKFVTAQYEKVMRSDIKKGIADLVVQDAFGRMGQASQHLYRSNQYRGLPLTDVPTSWQYLQWKLEYDATRRGQPDARTLDEKIANALVRQTGTSRAVINSISLDGLVSLRKSGLIQDLRNHLRDCFDRLEKNGDSQDTKIAEEVVRSFEAGMNAAAEAIAKHQSDKRTVAAMDVPAAVGATALAIAGAVGGNYWLTAAAAAATQFGLPTASSIWKKGQELVANGRKISQNPFCVLIQSGKAHS